MYTHVTQPYSLFTALLYIVSYILRNISAKYIDCIVFCTTINGLKVYYISYREMLAVIFYYRKQILINIW